MPKPPFVLVHGAWHDSSCWHKVVPLLKAEGRNVVTVDLPGRAGDPRSHKDITLEDFVDHVGATLDEIAEPAILVGHSLAGITLSMTAERWPDRIHTLVYITAMLLEDGQSIWDIVSKDEETLVPENVVMSEDQASSIVRDEALVKTFYADCSEMDIEFAQQHLMPEVSKITMARAALTPARFGRVHRVYIECTEDCAISLAAQRRMTAATPCDRVITMHTAHSPFFAAAEQLAEHLLSL